MKHFSHLNTAIHLLDQYTGPQPFSVFIKDYFRANKKYGSKDRKRISHLCYSYFRLGKALGNLSKEDRTLVGLFLSATGPDELLADTRPEWNSLIDSTLEEKIKATGHPLAPGDIFPFQAELSAGINPAAFSYSHLIQPSLFLRARPGYETIVPEKLTAAGIKVNVLHYDCINVPNTTPVEKFITMNREAVTQDYNSQRTGDLLKKLNPQLVMDAWDCCAASGGKSIMVYDWNPGIRLTLTDVRESILLQLRQRFLEAGIRRYDYRVADLSRPVSIFGKNSFDLLIADVPCTGSGTWSRTPEQLYLFKVERIQEYNSLQKKILTNAIPHIRPGGYLLFITCSVFSAENESNVQWMEKQFSLQLLDAQVLEGYEMKADTMFAALLRKPL